jgi:hypothetical protein
VDIVCFGKAEFDRGKGKEDLNSKSKHTITLAACSVTLVFVYGTVYQSMAVSPNYAKQ